MFKMKNVRYFNLNSFLILAAPAVESCCCGDAEGKSPQA